MEQTNAFKTNQNQAVQLSNPVELSDGIKSAWDSWFDAKGVSDDFMETRNQPIPQMRDGV